MVKSFKNLLVVLVLFLISHNLFAQEKVLIQGFYWDVKPGGVWYDTLSTRAVELAENGFNSIWFPPVYKGANGLWDVGYTPYDYYDLGEFDSRGGDQTSGTGEYIPTRYGTKSQLISAVQAYHSSGMEVYADIVLNHRSGGNTEPNNYAVQYPTAMPNDGNGNTWTSFPLSNGSRRIALNNGSEFFYPNASNNPGNTGDFYSESQYGYFKFYQNYFAYDNALHNGYGNNLPLGDSLLVWGDWLTNEVGFDGYRFDFVKGIHPVYLKAWCNYGAMNNKFYVGELYDGDLWRLKNWLEWMGGEYTGPGASSTLGTNHAPAVFDFNMRFAYKALSDQGNNYDIRTWHSSGLQNYNVQYERIVTFVDNHDFDRLDHTGTTSMSDHSPVIDKKMICYAHMLMSPGLASVWWRDYFYYGLKDQINNLIRIRRTFSSGNHLNLTAFTDGSGQYSAPYWPGNSTDDPKHVFVMQRMGDSADQGVLLVINKHSDYDIHVWVTSQKWHGMKLYDLTGNSSDQPQVADDGRVLIKAQRNSYSVYVPIHLSLPEGPLPVELNSFGAKKISDTEVKLSWETATEVNNYGFEVEKQFIVNSEQFTCNEKKMQWETITFINGHGNSNSPKSYSYIDKTAGYGTYKYRLKQIDTDGQFEVFDPVTVEFNSISKVVLEQNYPNPFNPTTQIKFGFEKPTKARLSVYNALGQKVKELYSDIAEANKIYQIDFDAENLPSGIYYYNLSSDFGNEVKKMVFIK